MTMSRELGRLAGVTAALLWLSAPRTAAATEPVCAIVPALAELPAAERDALKQACTGATPDEPTLQSAVFRMASLPGWRSAALARLLAPMHGPTRLLRRGETPASPDLALAQTSLAARPETLAGPRCADLRLKVDAFVAATQAGEAAASPFLHDDPALLRCLGDGAAPQGVRLVALRADNVDELFVAAATPDFAWLTWQKPGDALVFGRHRFFVVAVPAAAVVAAVARLANAEVPATWRAIVSHDEVAWPALPVMTCVSLDVRLDPRAQLFVDGAVVPRDDRGVSRVVAVTRQDHEIVVLECPDDDRPCHVRYREELAAAALQRHTNHCLPVRLDLVSNDQQTVTVLDVTEGERCREAPLLSDGLRQAANDHLSFGIPRERYVFRDLAAFAAANDALSALRTRLHTAGSTTGASTGADGTDLIGTAAKEAWRQGIDILLSFDLQCALRGDGWAYRLTATRVALGSVFDRGRHGGESLDLAGLIEKVYEEFTAPERLSVALAAAIDRSLKIRYLRLSGPSDVPYRRGAEFEVQRFADDSCATRCPDWECRTKCERQTFYTARRLNLGGPRPEVCRAELRIPTAELERVYSLTAGREAPLHFTLSGRSAGAGLQYSGLARLRGTVPGWYVVIARWADEPAASDATCVNLSTPSHEIWGDVTMSVGAFHLRPASAPDQLYLRTRVGYTYYVRPVIGLGGFAGYAYTSYQWADGRPEWQDLGVPGDQPLAWKRHALLIGGLVELRTRHARMPFDLRLRAAPTLSIGLLRLAGIPADLKQFLGGTGDGPIDVDVDVDLHFDAVFGYDIGRIAVQHMLLLGLHAINDPLRGAPATVRDNGGFFIGLGLGLGGAR